MAQYAYLGLTLANGETVDRFEIDLSETDTNIIWWNLKRGGMAEIPFKSKEGKTGKVIVNMNHVAAAAVIVTEEPL